MTSKQFTTLFIAVVASSLIGSGAISWLAHSSPARASQATVLRVHEIDIVNGSGRTVGSWSSKNNGADFSVYDAHGQRRVTIQTSIDDSPNMVFRDAHGSSRVGIGFASQNYPVVALADEQSRPRVKLELNNGSDPGISLLDASGSTTWHAP